MAGVHSPLQNNDIWFWEKSKQSYTHLPNSNVLTWIRSTFWQHTYIKTGFGSLAHVSAVHHTRLFVPAYVIILSREILEVFFKITNSKHTRCYILRNRSKCYEIQQSDLEIHLLLGCHFQLLIGLPFLLGYIWRNWRPRSSF